MSKAFARGVDSSSARSRNSSYASLYQRTRRVRLLSMAVAGVCALGSSAVRAQNVADNVLTQSQGGDGSNQLDDALMYSLGTVPTSANDLVFTNQSYGSTYSLANTALTVGSIDFLNQNDSVTIGGSLAFNLSGGSNSVSGNAGDLLFANSSLTLQFSAPIVLGANGNFDIANTNFNSTQIAGVISGSHGFTLTGGGSLVLTATNTYTGPTTINSGTLYVQSGNNAVGAINVNSAVTINNGGQIIINGFDNSLGGSGTGTNCPPVTINAGGVLNSSSGITSHVNKIFLAGGTMTAGTPTGDETTFGSYDLNGPVTVTAETITSVMSAPALQVQATGGTTFNVSSNNIVGGSTPGVDLLVSGTIGNIGSTGLIKSGAGVMLLSGTNTYSSATTVNAGTLLAGVATVGGTGPFGNNSPVTLANASGANLNLGNFNVSIGALAGGGTTGGNVIEGTGTLTLGGNNGSATFSGTISGSGGLIKAGTGTQNLSSGYTYTGLTTITGGTLGFPAAAVSLTGGVSITGGTLSVITGSTINGTNISGGTFFPASGVTLAGPTNVLGGTLNLSSGVIVSGATNVSGGVVNLGSGFSLNSPLQTGGQINVLSGSNISGGLTINGGTTTLATGGGISGGVVLNGGSLGVSSDAALSSVGALTFNGGAVQFNNYNTLLTFPASTYPNGVGVGAGGLSTLPVNALSGTYGGTGVTYGGTGLLIVPSQSYKGATTIGGGGVVQTTFAGLGTGNGNGAALSFNGGATLQIISGPIGDLSTERTITLNAGGGIIDLRGQNLTFAGLVGGVGSLTVSSTLPGGSLTLNSAAGYAFSGGVGIKSGTLTLDYSNLTTQPNLIGTTATSTLTLGGGTLNLVGGTQGGSPTAVTFANTPLQAGFNVINIGLTNANNPTLNFGTLIPSTGAVVQFNGVTTIDGSGATVNATGTITTTTGGAGNGEGNQILGGNGTVSGSYGTAGLYDWAAVNNGQIVGGSSIGGFYTQFGSGGQAITGNVDYTASPAGTNNSVRNINSIRFNTTNPGANFLWNPTTVTTTGGILVTPSIGAENVVIGGTAGQIEPSRGSTSGLTIWQNNTAGFLVGNVNNTFNDPKSPVGNYIFAGAGTVQLNFPNTYTGPSFIEGGSTVLMSGNYLGAPATAATATLNGGTVAAQASFVLDNGGGANPRPIALGGNGGGLAATTGYTLTIDGVISGGTNTGQLVIGIPGSNANGNITGLVSGTGAVATGQTFDTGNLTPVFATGTVILNNANNTYTGGTVVDTGTLQIVSALTSLPAANVASVVGFGPITLNGGTFQWGTSTTTDISTRSVTLASNSTLDTQGNNVTLANPIGGNGARGFTKQGSGLLTLNGANTFTGGVTLSAGNLALGAANIYAGPTNVNAGTLTLNSAASLGNTAITVAGVATFAANPGAGNISAGSTGASLTLNKGGFLVLNDGAAGKLILNTVGAGTGKVLTLNGTTAAPDYLTLDVGSTGVADEVVVNNGTIGFAGSPQTNVTLKPFGPNTAVPTTLTNIPLLFAPNTPAGTPLLASEFSLQTLTITTFNNSSSSPGSGQIAVYNASLGVLNGNTLVLNLTPAAVALNFYWKGATNASWNTINNFATDASGATPQTGTLNSSDNVFETATTASNLSQTLDGNYTINSLTFTGTGTQATAGVTLANSTLTINASTAYADSNNYAAGIGLVVEAGSGTNTISSGIALGNSQIWEIDNAPANPLIVSGIISDGASLNSLTKTGVGTLILSNSNTYDGGTIVSKGTLQIGITNALLPTGPVTVVGTGVLDLAGFGLTVGSLSDGGVATGTITSSQGTPVLTLNNSATMSFGGSLTGSLGVTTAGTAPATLSGVNTYTGVTNVSVGTLIAASNSSLGSSTSATGGLLLGGTGVVNFTSAAPTIASLSGTSGSVVLGNLFPVAPTTLTVGGGGQTTTFAGSISDQTLTNTGAIGNLIVKGGSLTLSGVNTFTGTTVVSGGTLTIANSNALQNSTLNYNSQGGTFSFGSLGSATLAGLSGSQSLALNSSGGGVTLIIGNGNVTSSYSGSLSGAGSVVKVGSGSVTLGITNGSGGATYTGSTAINNGTLTIGGNSNLTGSVDVTGSTATSNLIVQDNAIINSSAAFLVASGDADAGAGANSTANIANVTVGGNANVSAPSFSFGASVNRVSGASLTVQGTAQVNISGSFSEFATLNGTGQTGTTTVTLTSGNLSVGNFLTVTGGNANDLTVFNFNGGTLTALQSDPSGSAGTYFFPFNGQITANINAGAIFNNAAGLSDTINQGLFHGTTTPDGGVNKIGLGTWIMSENNDTYTGPTNVSAGTLVIVHTGGVPSGSKVNVALGALLVDEPNNVLAASGSLNVNGAMIVQLNPSLQTLNTAVGKGFANGAWNNSTAGSIYSSSAGADTKHLHALGVIQNSSDGTPGGPILYQTFENFSGINGVTSLNNSDVLIKYTYYGDTDLNGQVDGTDYSRIDNAFLNNQSSLNAKLTGWFNGDFNYDGIINGSDYTLIDNAYNSQGAQIAAELASPTAQLGGGGSSVPEPTSLTLLGIGTAGLLGRHRRRK